MSGASAWPRASTWLGTSGSGPSTITSIVLPTCAWLQAKATSCCTCHEPVAALLLDLLGQVAVELASAGVPGSKRVGEDAEPARTVLPATKSHQLLELRLRLAGEADDERRPQRQVRDRAAQLAEQLLGVLRGARAAASACSTRSLMCCSGMSRYGMIFFAVGQRLDQLVGEVIG